MNDRRLKLLLYKRIFMIIKKLRTGATTRVSKATFNFKAFGTTSNCFRRWSPNYISYLAGRIADR